MIILRTPNKPKTLVECLILLMIAAVLRVWFVGKTDLGYDESFSLYMSLQSLPEAVRMLCQGDNPPLWELLLHFWVKVFGISEVAIRSLSVVFSILTIIPIYLLGEKYIHRLAGITAALSYCFSTFSIYLSHDCRVYSLVGFFAASSVLFFVSIITTPKIYKIILLTIVNLMLMYGHYLSIWIIVMEFIIALSVKTIRQKIWKLYLFHISALIVLYIPMFPVLFSRFFDSGINGTWIAKTTSIEALYDFLWRMCNVPVVTVLAIAILISTLIILVIRIIKKQYSFGKTTILSLFWIIPLLTSFILSFFTGFFLDRYFYFLFPVFYLSVVAYCLFLFPKNLVFGQSLATLFTILMMISCSPDSSTKHFSGWHSEIKPIVDMLVMEKEQKDALVILPECFDKQFTYYLDENHEAFRTQSQPTTYYVFHDFLTQNGYFYDYNYSNADLYEYTRVVFLHQTTTPINGLREYLEKEELHLESEIDTGLFVVCRFIR